MSTAHINGTERTITQRNTMDGSMHKIRNHNMDGYRSSTLIFLQGGEKDWIIAFDSVVECNM